MSDNTNSKPLRRIVGFCLLLFGSLAVRGMLSNPVDRYQTLSRRAAISESISTIPLEIDSPPSNPQVIEETLPEKYIKLRDFLVAADWKNADVETQAVVLSTVGKYKNLRLTEEDLNNISCSEFRTLDWLWVKYSGGNFGFSVQQEIYKKLGGTKDYTKRNNVHRNFPDFVRKVGWYTGEKPLVAQNQPYSRINFSVSKKGQLPLLVYMSAVNVVPKYPSPFFAPRIAPNCLTQKSYLKWKRQLGN